MIQGMWSAERGGVLGLNGVVFSEHAFAKFMIRRGPNYGAEYIC